MSMLKTKLSWYLNRLRCMSPNETIFRIYKSIIMQLEKSGFMRAETPSEPDLSRTSRCFFGKVYQINKQPYINAAETILNGKINLLSYHNVEIGAKPNWNFNVINGVNAPMVFGKTLDYRDNRKVGDIKYIWIPNRHLQWVTLAQAFHLTDDRRYLQCIAEQLNTWLDQSPYLKGPNWTSSLELAIRLINWAFVWHLIGGNESVLFDNDDGKILKRRWLNSIYQQTHFIQRHYSRHSSANNHLIGELSGVFIATTVWPYWDKFQRWQNNAQIELIQEIEKQTTIDGVTREQTIFYQQFVLDFFLIAGLAGRANGIEFSQIYWQRIEGMLNFIASLMDASGHLPMIGDADDGYVVRLSQQTEFCAFKSLLATGAVLFNRGDLKVKAGGIDDKTKWLLGNDAITQFNSIDTQKSILPVQRDFPQGGYYILGQDFESEKEIRAVVDAGPLGYLSICAHGHADALAMTLSIAGKETLIDPGTYAYQSKKEWRNYFRGTSAHNTVCIDGKDQSVMGGNFMWLTRAEAHCKTWETNEEEDYFVGEHNGYMRLSDPVMHQRDIRLNKGNRSFKIIDTIQCKSIHTVERYWHFSEDVIVTKKNDLIIAENSGVKIHIKSPDSDTEINLIYGNDSPPGGWVSRHFDVKVPATVLIFKNEIINTTQLITDIFCDNWNNINNNSTN